LPSAQNDQLVAPSASRTAQTVEAIVLVWLRRACVVILLIALSSAESAWAIGMNQQFFRNGLLKGLPDLDQYSLKFYDGQLRGLTDSSERQILPAIYADIYYCGHGIFLATGTDPLHKFYFSKTRHIFNRDGVELPVTAPEGTTLLNIFSFGQEADAYRNIELSRLDPNTILLYGSSDGCEGLCDAHGTIILPALPGEIRYVSSHLAYVEIPHVRYDIDLKTRGLFGLPRDSEGVRDSHGTVIPPALLGNIHYVSTRSAYVEIPNARYVIDLKTGKRTPSEGGYRPGAFPAPRLPWHSGVGVPMGEMPQDRKINTIGNDDGLFDKEYWTERREYPIGHLAMFDRFLHEHNLIGMTEGEATSYLDLKRSPNNKTLVCMFPDDGCTPMDWGIRMYLKDGKVENWCFFYGGDLPAERESEPVSSNVILEGVDFRSRIFSFSFHMDNRHGEFPKTTPKVPTNSKIMPSQCELDWRGIPERPLKSEFIHRRVRFCASYEADLIRSIRERSLPVLRGRTVSCTFRLKNGAATNLKISQTSDNEIADNLALSIIQSVIPPLETDRSILEEHDIRVEFCTPGDLNWVPSAITVVPRENDYK
jgi:hypothetical protein